uniref:Uncharacterized protein n=1 Tax=Morchella importuna TaxID=1174673 RepID=A0A650AF71_9PEZI|nr:hypothetical protein [Morchella importuna]QGN66672.1 hypothetical protein [Morchella importuna]
MPPPHTAPPFNPTTRVVRMEWGGGTIGSLYFSHCMQTKAGAHQPWSACQTLLILELHILWISLLHWDIQGRHTPLKFGRRPVHFFYRVRYICYPPPPPRPPGNKPGGGSYFLWKKAVILLRL